MKHLPNITKEQVAELAQEIQYLIKQGKLINWANEEMQNMEKDNPVLLAYIKEHSEQFAMGITMSMGNTGTIIMSKMISFLMLLLLLSKSLAVTAPLNKEEILDQVTEMLKEFDNDEKDEQI